MPGTPSKISSSVYQCPSSLMSPSHNVPQRLAPSHSQQFWRENIILRTIQKGFSSHIASVAGVITVRFEGNLCQPKCSEEVKSISSSFVTIVSVPSSLTCTIGKVSDSNSSSSLPFITLLAMFRQAVGTTLTITLLIELVTIFASEQSCSSE